MQFRIEYVASIKGQGHVLARQSELGDFHLPECPTLGGLPITRELSQPRVLTEDGTQDFTVFVFHLVSHSDAAKLSVGQLVELSAAIS
jgi:hypothetical protein